MSILDPAVRFVGSLSFRRKMHVTALIFGVPLVIMPANHPHALHAVQPFKMALVMIKEK